MFVSQEPVVDLKKASIPLIESWKDEFREIRQDFHRNLQELLERSQVFFVPTVWMKYMKISQAAVSLA